MYIASLPRKAGITARSTPLKLVGNHCWKIETYLLVDPNTNLVSPWIHGIKQSVLFLELRARAEFINCSQLFARERIPRELLGESAR
jgi:hypothetical protein